MKQIDYQRLSQRLKTTQSRYPNISLKNFQTELKGTLNNREAERLFDVFVSHQYILPTNRKNYFTWRVHQDFFEIEGIRKLCVNNSISTSMCMSSAHRKRINIEKPISLASFTDEQLLAELNNREKSRKQKQLNDILAVAELDLNSLKRLIAEVE